ncbi:VOC family protein [Paracoccus sp. MBLB3053]|uniref:VOC family protein n=1 Tax=Paracoccus aurantius TaxID=3073814 RepID=A0ABU2HX19_9RHOB|nr:VOC family protein [Paracoccus sp. MBLB3053]MDS9469065.1 VOC family protein [Paracoccus sp. MBLB3053]
MSRFLGPIRQLGFVVPDIEEAMDHWTRVMGVGPFYYNPRVPIEDYLHDGERHEPENSVALANAGYVQVELIQCRNDVPSMYKEFRDAGNWGLQHTAYWTQDYDRDLRRMEDEGFRVRMSGRVGIDGRFAYFDRETHPGTVIELSEVKGPKGRLFDLIREASQDWDGSNPVRPFPDLATL